MTQRVPIRTGGTSTHPAAAARRGRVAGSGDLMLAEPIRVDREGRITVRPSKPITDLESGASLEEVITRFNQLLVHLRAAGFIER